MTYYEQATHIALRLGRWAQSSGSRAPKSSYEIELELAQARQVPEAPAKPTGQIGVFTTLSRLFVS